MAQVMIMFHFLKVVTIWYMEKTIEFVYIVAKALGFVCEEVNQYFQWHS